LPGRHRHPRLILELALHAFLIAGRREGELQVGALGGFAGVPEAIDHGRRQREQAAARCRPFQSLDPEMPALAKLVDGPDVLHPRDRTWRVMILQALADT